MNKLDEIEARVESTETELIVWREWYEKDVSLLIRAVRQLGGMVVAYGRADVGGTGAKTFKLFERRQAIDPDVLELIAPDKERE